MPDASGFRIAEPKPTIEVVAGELDTLATAAEHAVAQSHLPVFQRGGTLVRPVTQEVPAARGRMTTAAGLRDVTRSGLLDMMAQSACYTRYDARRKRAVPMDPPSKVADVILSRAGSWTVPTVAGVITTPTLRADGTVLVDPGYDAATRLYLVATPDLVLPALPPFPSRAQGEAALADLDKLLDGFPFAASVDRAVALSALITPVIRGAIAVAPLHAFRAFTAGSGKSYLADLASAIATGRPCPVAAAGATEEETEKRLVGLLLAGYPIVSLDNCNGELGGDLLCQAVERPLVRLRPLGSSTILEIESRASLFATGNALRVRGDMVRRSVVCTLDAAVERPELRTFAFDPVERVLADRGRYVAAGLILVRAYQHAGSPGQLRPVASFADWSNLVRSALVWLGQHDPAASMEAAREDDPELSELREVLTTWRSAVGLNSSVTCKVLADIASSRYRDDLGHDAEHQHPEFQDVLLRIAGERGLVNTKRLGKWLLAREGRVVEGKRLRRVGMAHGGVMQWRLEAA